MILNKKVMWLVRQKHWLYIGWLISLALGHLFNKVVSDSGGFASRYVPLILVLIIALGFAGYVFKKPLFKREFWVFYFSFVGLTGAAMAILSIYLVVIVNNTYLGAVTFAILVVLLPSLYILYEYTFRSQAIWNTDRTID